MRVLILGTGEMAREHASGFAAIEGVEIVAAVDISRTNLEAFAAEFGIPHLFASIDDAIAWGEFDAASNVTPDQVHHATTLALIAAGKHVLCEKPLAMDYDQASEMANAAEAAGVVNLVNFTYRAMPASVRACEMVRSGMLGDIRHFNAAYLQSWLVADHWGNWRTERRWLWRLSQRHGSHGVVGDVGVHVVNLLSYVAGENLARLQAHTATFHKAPGDHIGEYVLDANDSFTLQGELQGGAIGVLHATRWGTGWANNVSIDLYGSHGALRLSVTARRSRLEACTGSNVHALLWEEEECPPTPSNYRLFVDAVRDGRNAGANFREAAHTQRVLDMCLSPRTDGEGMRDVDATLER